MKSTPSKMWTIWVGSPWVCQPPFGKNSRPITKSPKLDSSTIVTNHLVIVQPLRRCSPFWVQMIAWPSIAEVVIAIGRNCCALTTRGFRGPKRSSSFGWFQPTKEKNFAATVSKFGIPSLAMIVEREWKGQCFGVAIAAPTLFLVEMDDDLGFVLSSKGWSEYMREIFKEAVKRTLSCQKGIGRVRQNFSLPTSKKFVLVPAYKICVWFLHNCISKKIW